jgi:hypothetical protein
VRGCVCVCAPFLCVRACVHVCMCACASDCMRAHAGLRARGGRYGRLVDLRPHACSPCTIALAPPPPLPPAATRDRPALARGVAPPRRPAGLSARPGRVGHPRSTRPAGPAADPSLLGAACGPAGVRDRPFRPSQRRARCSLYQIQGNVTLRIALTREREREREREKERERERVREREREREKSSGTPGPSDRLGPFERLTSPRLPGPLRGRPRVSVATRTARPRRQTRTRASGHGR